jgi:hypothetical protein
VSYIVEKIIAANATQSAKTGGPPFLAMN